MSVYSRGSFVAGQRNGLSSAGARNLLVGQYAIKKGILSTFNDSNVPLVSPKWAQLSKQ
jgi:hypothetical protein